ncbi:MAG: iron-containing alcohol dehydrogenase [Bacteroidales bacterium]
MENFKISIPTTVHFGKGVLDELGEAAVSTGRKALLVYGKGSVKRNGVYGKIRQQLDNQGIEVTEFEGIKPNPLADDVNRAAELGKEAGVDMIIAAGGGSVIDSAKMISVCIGSDTTAWRIMIGMEKPKAAVPLLAVLTLAATGTEMNPFAVLQNEQAGKKLGYGHPLMYPKHSFLDPAITLTVPASYTSYGIVDLIAHALENYFGKGDAPLADRFVFSILQEAMDFAKPLLNNLQDYELRARMMYAAMMALNGTTLYGRASGDWGVHSVGHVISVLYDTAHGATLSIAYPAWLRLMTERTPDRIALLGRNVFGTADVNETIEKTEQFFRSIIAPVRLQEAGIEEAEAEKISKMLTANKAGGMHHELIPEDHQKLVRLMFGDF